MSSVKCQVSSVHKRGFTLLEFLIVVALVAMLATVTVFALRSARRETRDHARIATVSKIRTSLELGFAQLANYPVQAEGNLRLGGAGAHWLCEVGGLPQFVDDSANCSGTLFTPEIIPASPRPADGDCATVQNEYQYLAGSGGTDYAISFCLGKAPPQSGLRDGLNCARPGGLEPGSCR